MTPLTRFQKLAVATAVSTIVLFAVGGLVRGTGSGLGCDTWPECTPGRLFPAGTIHSLIEFSHRFLVFVSTVLVVLTAVFAWRDKARYRPILGAATAAIPLVLAQAVLGGIVVKTDLNPWWVTGHFAVALVFVADVVYVAVNAICLARREPATGGRASDGGFARLALLATVATFALLFVGTLVRAKGAGLAFTDWPLMNGRLVPALGGAATFMFLHRVLAALVFVLVLYVMVRARTMTRRSRDLVRLSTLLAVLFVGEIVVGAAQVWTRLRPWPVVGHVALSVLIWAALVTLATVAHRLRITTAGVHPGVATPERPDMGVTAPEAKPSLKDTVAAYYHLTKPEIIFLLLVTTVPAMFLAAHRVPSLWLILATLVEGAGRRLGQRDQHVPRPRHRRDHAPHAQAAAPLARGHARPRAAVRIRAGRRLLLLPVDHGERAGGDARALGDRVLRVRLHDVAEAHDDAEHRDRRRGRRGPGAGRVGRRDRDARGAGLDLVRDHLRVDPAAFLGARCATRATTPPPASRCCPSCAASWRPGARSSCIRWCCSARRSC